MSKPVSVVIICKNEEEVIGETIRSLLPVSDDIICVDSGSTDRTIEIIKQSGARLIETNWEGYGKTKNKGVAAARHNWILTLDSDEQIDPVLQQSILNEPFDNEKVVYDLSYQTFYIGKRIKFGEWGHKETHIRLFNRNHTHWQNVEVHEQVEIPADTIVKSLAGYVHHHTVKSYEAYLQKTVRYGLLNGRKYFQQGKKVSLVKLWFAPAFSFIYNYFFRFGFLDGWEGFLIARTTAFYTFIKYAHLRELQNKR